MDANFKLKQKERGFSDPPLSNGLAYMISNERLQEHLIHCTNKGLITEVSVPGVDRGAILKLCLLDQYLWFYFQRG